MANITLSLDEQTLNAARAYAKEQGWSLNELVRRLLQKTVAPNTGEQLQAVFARADDLQCASDSPWKREDLYDRPVLR